LKHALYTGINSDYPMSDFATGQIAVQFVNAITGVHYSQFEFGNGSFRLDILDTALGGQTDQYGFTAYRMDGSMLSIRPTSGR